MTTPRPHAHAEAWITQWHYRDDRSEQQRHGFAGAQLWWSEKQLAGRDPISGRYGSRPRRTKLNVITPMLMTGAAAAAIAAAPTEAAESGRCSQ
jgi:hypothetical protein